ncbi:Tubulin [Parasponia andersonii]|uniref:Tubulin n=1 Tax=Parasponia andersonii TaxID=3476 RepID=A0A2P5CMC6_PARAD|nr:Tubulin [Parasponia andersonii]
MRDVILHIQEGQRGNHTEPKFWEILRDKHVGGPTGRYVGEISDLLERENIYNMEDAKLIDTGLNYMRNEAQKFYLQEKDYDNEELLVSKEFYCFDNLLGRRPSCNSKQEKELTRWRPLVMKQRIT